MYQTYRSLYDRSLEKTPEQLFINSLKKEFELSRKFARSVARTPHNSVGRSRFSYRYIFPQIGDRTECVDTKADTVQIESR